MAGPLSSAAIAAILIWLAYLWVKEVCDRFPADLEELANSDDLAPRAVIVFYWLATLAIAAVVIWRVWAAVSVLKDLLR